MPVGRSHPLRDAGRSSPRRLRVADLANGDPTPFAIAAWTAFDSLWKAPPDQRVRLLESNDIDILPALPQLPMRPLRLGDVEPGLPAEHFGRAVADAIAARRDAVLWAIEDRVLGAPDAVNRSAGAVRDSATERQLVASIVVPPLALSFGAIGVIANAMALFLLIPGLIVAMPVRHPARGLLRTLRLASVIAPWLAWCWASACTCPSG